MLIMTIILLFRMTSSQHNKIGSNWIIQQKTINLGKITRYVASTYVLTRQVPGQEGVGSKIIVSMWNFPSVPNTKSFWL